MTNKRIALRKLALSLLALALLSWTPLPAQGNSSYTDVLASQQTAQANSDAADPQQGVDLATVQPNWWRGSDFLVTGRGDGDGYHLSIGWEKERYAFRPLATVQPAGYDGDDWLGSQCVTGDHKSVVVSVLPRWAVNRSDRLDRGALAYVISVDSGQVRPLIGGVAFKYHSLRCGAGSEVVLLRHLGFEQERTELLRADAAAARITARAEVVGQLTNAVPVGNRLFALRGAEVIEVAGTGRTTTVRPVARTAGEPFSLTASGSSAEVLVLRGQSVALNRLELERSGQPRLRPMGEGPVQDVQLLSASGKRTVTVGLTRAQADTATVKAPRLQLPDRPERKVPVEAVSAEGKVIWSSTTEVSSSESTQPKAPATAEDTSTKPFRPIKRLFSARSGELLTGDATVPPGTPAVTATPRSADPAGQPSPHGRANSREAATPSCAVPRNDPRRTAYGATNKQIAWAAEMAPRNLLVGANARPSNYLSSGLPAYAPSSDFSLPKLQPAGGYIPPAVMNGVLAQESAYRHASRRTLPGSGGNTVIGDYYGARGTLDKIDYTKADCGYGVAQVTTGMRVTDSSISPNGKAKIAIDYAANVQAGANILAQKWNQLYAANIRLNDSNPAYVENWYLALWAYNSGVQPDARFGNPTGCTPGPSCTDDGGRWGLGWTNNPRNSDYPPNRAVFLRDSYADAEHPNWWAYQERILGWAETPIRNYRGEPSYLPAIPGPGSAGGAAVRYPSRTAFCSTANSCDPTTQTGQGCTRADFRCWWHESVEVANCSLDCARSPFNQPPGASEPAGNNPWKPECDSDLGPRAVIVDDLTDPSANIFCPNRNWSNSGTFSYEVGNDTTGAPLGIIDFHQVATGFGAHTWFTGNRLARDPAHRVTGTWQPNALTPGPYIVKAHIPVAGAGAESAVYRITTANGEVKQRTINQHEHYNHWKSLGVYQLGSNAKVALDNVTALDKTEGVGTVAWDAIAFVPAPGRYVEQTMEAYAHFDENTDLDTSFPTSWLAGPLASRQALYDWALERSSSVADKSECISGPHESCTMPQTRAAMRRWKDQVVAAGTDPVNHPLGQSIPAWMLFSNDWRDRPTSAVKPPNLDSNDHVYKIKSKVVVSYVVGEDGRLVEGSVDTVGTHRSADTIMPTFVRETFTSVHRDYGIVPPLLSYTTEDLYVHNHQPTATQPNEDGIFPGRAYTPAAAKPVIYKEPNTDCIETFYASGGSMGYKPMLGVRYVSARVDAWLQQVNSRPEIPQGLKEVANDIYETFFQLGVVPGSLFNGAPPIWQELNFRVCLNGDRPFLGRGSEILRASLMPNQYLYYNGRAIEQDGHPRNTAQPLLTGDFNAFSNMPRHPGDDPFNECDRTSGRAGNPWDMSATDGADTNPTTVHFCVDPDIPVSGDHG